MSGPISPPATSAEAGDHLPPYVSNGVIGLRVRSIPLVAGAAVLNGVAGEHPETGTESEPFVPYPLSGDIVVDGLSMLDNLFRTRPVDQRYDFSCGELTTRFTFRTERVEVRAETVTFCSRTEPHLVVQQTTVEVDAACDLELHAGVSFANIVGRQTTRRAQREVGDDFVDGSLAWQTLGEMSQCGVAYATGCTADADRTVEAGLSTGPLQTKYAFRARSGSKYVLTQIGSLVGSLTNRITDHAAVRLAAKGMKVGADTLRAENRRAWADVWGRRVVLRGADREWQALADAAFFYLNTSVHLGAVASTHIFGLSQWKTYHHYYGQVMWDIEAFALPVVMLTQPDAARTLLDYRWRTRHSAHANAQANGYCGLQYPWQAGPSGEEAAPGEGMGAAFAHHVSPDVAHAFAQFGFTTGDRVFLRERAWPVLVGVADFLRSRVTQTERGYEILRSMGIAEREEPCDNGVFMNAAAKVVLRDVAAVAEWIGEEPQPWWESLERGIVVPTNAEGTRLVSHDGFRSNEEKGSTPDPLAAIFPLELGVAPAVERETLRYFLELADDYIGQPMLSALYGAWAARAGDRRLSARLFTEGYARFVSDRFATTYEWRPDRYPEYPPSGPFIANLAGFLQAILFGLTRVTVGPGAPDTWLGGPVVMPESWDGVEVDGLNIRGREARLSATHGDATATLELGELCV